MNKPPAPPSTPSDKPARRPVSFSQPFDLSGLPERSLPKINGRSRHTAVAAPGIDLAGRPKVWFVIGRGRIGKTTLIRWAAETLAGRGGAECVYAAADPVNRSLKTFLREVDVSEPPTADPDEVALGCKGCSASRCPTMARRHWWTSEAGTRHCRGCCEPCRPLHRDG